MIQRFLLHIVTPLGWLIYGAQLSWNECCRKACQRKNPADPDLRALVLKSAHLRSLLPRRY